MQKYQAAGVDMASKQPWNNVQASHSDTYMEPESKNQH